VAHVLREASFPQTEFDQLKREVVTGLESQRTDPNVAANDVLLAAVNTYPAGDPRRYISLTERLEQVPKLTRDDLAAFHKQFYGTARGEIAIVGDFDDKEIERLLQELFASWASPAPYARILSEPRPTPAQRLVAVTPDKENASYRARIVLALRDDDPDLPALLLANYIFGGGSGLSNRLMDRVRQRDGLSYGIGSGLSINGRDRAGSFSIGAIAAPQNMAKVEAAVREELERSLRDGFTDKEVQDARNGLLQERVLARSEDSTLAANWVNNLELERTFQYSKAVEARLRSLTTAEVNAAWRRHIDPAKFTIAIGGDPARGIK
jgi:zinc protease